VNIHKDIIKSHGLRITPARVSILNIFDDSDKPLDISTIITLLGEKKVAADQATIYRIIENFVEKDLLVRLQFQEKKYFYEKRGREHHHAICKKCGSITDIAKCNIKRLERGIMQNMKFKVTNHSLEFFGTCVNCS
jgi:Fe2+ or Zn2+ uptake regulation protein